MELADGINDYLQKENLIKRKNITTNEKNRKTKKEEKYKV